MAKVGDIEQGFIAIGNIHKSEKSLIDRMIANGKLVKETPLETEHYSSQELSLMGIVSIWLPHNKEKA